MSLPLSGNAYVLEIVKLGLVMVSFTPNAFASPRTRVVFPAPTSPINSTTVAWLFLCASILFASSCPNSIISTSDLIFIGIIIAR